MTHGLWILVAVVPALAAAAWLVRRQRRAARPSGATSRAGPVAGLPTCEGLGPPRDRPPE